MKPLPSTNYIEARRGFRSKNADEPSKISGFIGIKHQKVWFNAEMGGLNMCVCVYAFIYIYTYTHICVCTCIYI